MPTTHSQTISAISILLFLLANISLASTGYLYRGSYTTINVESGVYSVSFSTSSYVCGLTLGVISVVNSNDLNKLSKSIPSTFTLLKKDDYSGTVNSISISDSSYFVLFNNNSACYYSSFTSEVKLDSMSTSSIINLPYGITKTFKNTFTDPKLVIKSQSSSTIDLNVYSDYSISYSTPTTSKFKTVTLSRYGSTQTFPLSTYSFNSYIYLNCRTLSGCPVYLSTESSSYDSSSPIIIEAIIGPIVAIAVCPLIIIISLISIAARRRRLATTTVYSTNTEHIPIYVPQNISVSQPHTTQPQTYYGNQSQYSQLNASQPQTSQPITYQSQNPYSK